MNIITEEDIKTLEGQIKRLEAENKALRMTLLDDFAKAALIGFWSDGTDGAYLSAAKWSYQMASAMIEERKLHL